MDEKLLIKQVLDGNESAYRVLMGRYERLIFHMVARVVDDQMDREELCQDVFVKIYEKLHTFQFDSKLSTWVATIAFRLAVNFAKKRKLNLQNIEDGGIEKIAFENKTEEKDQRDWVHFLINKLPVHYKVVLTMFYLEGFNYQEIVEITEMPEGTVKNYIHRARQKLKILIKEHANTELSWN